MLTKLCNIALLLFLCNGSNKAGPSQPDSSSIGDSSLDCSSIIKEQQSKIDQLNEELKEKDETMAALYKMVAPHFQQQTQNTDSNPLFVNWRKQNPIFDSKILSIKEESQLNQRMISLFGNYNYKLLFRASRDGYDAKSFHEKCDYMGPTIVIIKNSIGNIYGGFTMVPWQSEFEGKWKEDKEAFLFLLKSTTGENVPQFYPIEPDNDDSAVYHDSQYGPVFGENKDIEITDSCDKNKPTIIDTAGPPEDDYDCSNELLTGTADNNFVISDYEIYSIETHFNSKIMSLKEENDLNNLITSTVGNSNYKLLFSTMRDGYSPIEFHKKCDKKGSTVVIIKNSIGNIYGGFTNVPWQSKDGYTLPAKGEYKRDNNAFLFLLKSANGEEVPRKFPIKDDKKMYAVYHKADYGPTFGGGHDINIVYNNHMWNVPDNVGYTYKDCTAELLTGICCRHEESTVSDYEVYLVTND